MNRRPQLTIVAGWAGSVSPEEAAAVVAALEQFMRNHAPALAQQPPSENAWKRAALDEGVRRAPAVLPRWA